MLYFDCETLSTGDDGTPVKIILAVTRVNGVNTVFRETPAAPFTESSAIKLAKHLVSHVGGPICTFNGAAFDFKIVAAMLPAGDLRANLIAVCVHKHVDIFFDWFTAKGYFASMQSFCVGNKLAGKSWTGAESAAAAIHAVDPCIAAKESEEIMVRLEQYCSQDTVCLEQICDRLRTECSIKRTAAASGKTTVWTPWNIRTFRSVAQCLRHAALKKPDVAWMSTPPPAAHDLVSWITL